MAIHPGLNSRYTVDQKKGEKTMAYLKGYVDHIRFRNEDNGYTVLSLDVDGDEETVVGSFPFLNDGEYISLEGDYVDHPVHGPQFQMRTYEGYLPSYRRGARTSCRSKRNQREESQSDRRGIQ